MRSRSSLFLLSALALFLAAPRYLDGQSDGSIEGQVTLAETGDFLRRASVVILENGRTASTDDEGRYRFEGVAPGVHHLEAHLDSALTHETQRVEVAAGQTATVDFVLGLATQEYEITVTSSGRQETAFESFQAVNSLNSFDLAESIAPGIGEVLDNAGSGVASRSFGPGNSRPIVRGFDGDRVLVMQDGIRTGTLSSQSGDHGELMNTAALERVEVVKGPATLLYGSNAMGGVVNAVTRHHAVHEHPHAGLRGFISGSGGTANAFGGGAGGFEYGHGRWMLWGGGGGQRTGDYTTPVGEIFNSRTRLYSAYGGLGWYGDKTYFSLGYQADDGDYGVPFAEQFEAHGESPPAGAGDPEVEEEGVERITLESERQSYQVNWGLRNPSKAIENFALRLNFTRWEHDEIEFLAGGERETGTVFDQNQFVYRGTFEQAPAGRLTGRFGFWGLARDYDVTGAEALSPPVDQDAFAVFALEEIGLERVQLQFGGRLETNRYDPAFAVRGGGEDQAGDHGTIEPARRRTFTGASAAAGVRTELWKGGAFLVNYSHSHRAPALEELYNFGPHIGSLSFEIGDPNLDAETGNGIELSLKQRGDRHRGELNLFYYRFGDFVFPFATGEVEDGLQVIEFTQLDSRFIGGEANLSLALHRDVWLNLGLDFVDAQESVHNTPLPRIPPLRGRVGFDFRHKGLSVRPGLVLASDQHQTFTGETRMPGYVVGDLKASYTIPQGRLVHQFAVNVFNIGDTLYRNHTSFIKDLAPEIGRGVRLTYKIRFF